jgi:hypothetical protein
MPQIISSYLLLQANSFFLVPQGDSFLQAPKAYSFFSFPLADCFFVALQTDSSLMSCLALSDSRH